jgi:hypothetical protein
VLALVKLGSSKYSMGDDDNSDGDSQNGNGTGDRDIGVQWSDVYDYNEDISYRNAGAHRPHPLEAKQDDMEFYFDRKDAFGYAPNRSKQTQKSSPSVASVRGPSGSSVRRSEKNSTGPLTMTITPTLSEVDVSVDFGDDDGNLSTSRPRY